MLSICCRSRLPLALAPRTRQVAVEDKGEDDKSSRKVWNSFADAEADSHDAHGAPLGADEAEAWISSKTREECTAFLSLQFADLCFSPGHSQAAGLELRRV